MQWMLGHSGFCLPKVGGGKKKKKNPACFPWRTLWSRVTLLTLYDVLVLKCALQRRQLLNRARAVPEERIIGPALLSRVLCRLFHLNPFIVKLLLNWFKHTARL